MQIRSLIHLKKEKQSIGINKAGATLMLILFLVAGVNGRAYAFPAYWNSFRTTYPAAALALASDCRICHVSPSGGGTRTSYGNAYRTANFSFSAIEPLDSDSDGYTNIVEITAITWPQDATSHPTDSTAPTVTAFAIPATSASLTVAITTFTATDAVGVTGYLVTESSTVPAASAAGWTASAPATYTFATEGSKTLYAWAKDAAGNVSSALSATVAITLINNSPGTIQGSVSVNFVGHSNLGVANATVSLSGTNYITTTDANGNFILTNIPPGSYQIQVLSGER